MKKKILAGAIASALALTLAGCSSSSSEKKETITGQAIDGLLWNMSCSASDASAAMTDQQGRYTIEVPPAVATSSNVSCTSTPQTRDMALYDPADPDNPDAVFEGELTAPAGSRNVTPVTSLVVALRGEGADLAEAQTLASEILGVDVVSLDSDPTQDPDVYAAAQTVHQVVNTIAAAARSDDNTIPPQAAYRAVMQSLADTVRESREAGETINLNDSTSVAEVTRDTVTRAASAVAAAAGMDEAATEKFTAGLTAPARTDAIAAATETTSATVQQTATSIRTEIEDAETALTPAEITEAANKAQRETAKVAEKQLETVAPNRPAPIILPITPPPSGGTGAGNDAGTGSGQVVGG